MLRAALTSALHRPVVQAWHSKTAWLLRFRVRRARTRASLRRVCSRDLLDPAESLVLQTCGQQPPTASADCTVEPTFLCDSRARLLDGATRRTSHRAHVEVLDPDHVEPPREVSGGLLDPVLPSIPLTGFQLRDRPFRLPRRLEPRLARASRCCNTFNRFDSPRVSLVHAAVRRSTTRPTPQRRDRCRPRCSRPGRRSGWGYGRTRYASDRPDHE